MADTTADVICEERGRAGFITLNRPKALNAVTLDMIHALHRFTKACAASKTIYGIVMEGEGKAFSAGGDIRAIYDHGRTNTSAVEKFYADEYAHNWTLERFKKPHVALIDGVVMGGGVGVSIYGTHRVGGTAYRFAMPETGIGFFPDIGGGWFLPRLPGAMGMYLGLTGKIIGQADAYACGLITHCIPRERFEEIKTAMADGQPVDQVLNGLHQDPGPGALAPVRSFIDRAFAKPTLVGILAALEAETGEHAAFAQETLTHLRKRSPLSMRVTFEQLKRGPTYATLKEALIVEYRLATRFLREPDLYEGIRAVIVDKTHDPKWDAARVEDIPEERVQAFFAPLPGGDLVLPDL
jgi:enoyl-CoA hydratase